MKTPPRVEPSANTAGPPSASVKMKDRNQILTRKMGSLAAE
ncbi:hypothetical protein FQN60_001291 [Etheostoma spectabile]|uniref:Uncharacterized protein n=1 Tax=Etheostoma spectabile TaxID=54343 RepID=A0A5J5D268_9PERO|nr:hypothetical protein FQN60_001291 [Etheostoma spectabile]